MMNSPQRCVADYIHGCLIAFVFFCAYVFGAKPNRQREYLASAEGYYLYTRLRVIPTVQYDCTYVYIYNTEY